MLYNNAGGLQRMYRTLQECINKRVAQEEHQHVVHDPGAGKRLKYRQQ